MRIFIDCTYTAINPHLNTGIQRVVRHLTFELINIGELSPNLDVIPVSFDGIFIKRVPSLYQREINEYKANQIKTYLPTTILNKVINKIKSLASRSKRKFNKIMSNFGLIDYERETNILNNFDGVRFSSEDVYLIADANWILPESYYGFLQHLKSHGVKIIFICYDLIPIKFPEFCPAEFCKDFTGFYTSYCKVFDRVIAISQKIAEDYIEFKQKQMLMSGEFAQEVNSFKLGCDFNDKFEYIQSGNFFEQEALSIINQKYILVVGSLVPHKNPQVVVAAFDLLLQAKPDINDIHLIFVGKRDWHKQTIDTIESNKMYGKLIHIFDSVDDSQLEYLYKNCYCLVQPSFYEGFGLPVVEGLQHCKPVISSNAGSLPEVGGKFCLYFNPNQPTELYEALNQLLNSTDEYETIINTIKAEYHPFSWKESAEQVLTICQETINKNKGSI